MPPAPPRLGVGPGRPGAISGADSRWQTRARAQLRRPAARPAGAHTGEIGVYTRDAAYARSGPKGLSASLLADSDVDLDEPAPPPPKPQRPDLNIPYDSSGLTPIPNYDQLREEVAREEKQRTAIPVRRNAPHVPSQIRSGQEATGSGFQRRELLLRAEQVEARLSPRMEAVYAGSDGWDSICASWLASESIQAALV